MACGRFAKSVVASRPLGATLTTELALTVPNPRAYSSEIL